MPSRGAPFQTKLLLCSGFVFVDSVDGQECPSYTSGCVYLFAGGDGINSNRPSR